MKEWKTQMIYLFENHGKDSMYILVNGQEFSLMTHIVEDVSAGYARVCVSTRGNVVHVLAHSGSRKPTRIPEQVT